MKKILLGLFIIGLSSVSAKCIGTVVNGKCIGTTIGESTSYKSDAGTRYQYDMSNASDRRSYSTDIGAQQRDKYDSLYNNYDRHIEKDRKNGQYGGGIYSND